MPRPRRSLLDPSSERRDLFGRELFFGVRRRHSIARVLARDPRDELAPPGVARNDGDRLRDALPVEPQFTLSTLRIGTVARKTFVGQNRPNVAVETKSGRIRAQTLSRHSRGEDRETRGDEPNRVGRTARPPFRRNSSHHAEILGDRGSAFNTSDSACGPLDRRGESSTDSLTETILAGWNAPWRVRFTFEEFAGTQMQIDPEPTRGTRSRPSGRSGLLTILVATSFLALTPKRAPATERPAERWWSLKPLDASIEVPRESHPEAGRGARNEIDAFIRRRLAEEGIAPSPPAEPRALVRRLYVDLLGLPPELERVRAFERDPSDAAYVKLVDDLLASPHYGERWARHWLDVVRYGESDGFERNRLRGNAWPYRDWVIRALNRDMPYDEFVRKQISGDLTHPGSGGYGRGRLSRRRVFTTRSSVRVRR